MLITYEDFDPRIRLPSIETCFPLRSYQIRGALAFLFRLAVGEDLIALCGADNKGLVIARKHTAIDTDIPFFQWCPHCFDLTADALLDG